MSPRIWYFRGQIIFFIFDNQTRIRSSADFLCYNILPNFDYLWSLQYNFFTNLARMSRLLRFWGKFQEISNDHALFEIEIFLGQASI